MTLFYQKTPPPSIARKNWAFLLIFGLISLFQHQVSAQNFNLVERAHLPIPNQTLANICGWSKNGRDYAILGGSRATVIVDVTNPAAPAILKQITNVTNQWKEIKVYRGYSYTVSEGGGGLQITNLNGLPDTTLPTRMYTGDSSIAGTYSRTHALHIDTTKGFLYLFGTAGLNGSGATILNLQDPCEPRYVGKYDARGYIHDGYVDNDTLYAGHINGGYMTIVDMRNKSNPVVLSQTTTPGSFTHNTWLTKDRKAVLTTDEIPNSVLASYDVSNPAAPRLLEKTQITPGSGSIVHNTHIRGNYAVTSWYRDGIVITDVTRPNNMVHVGWYDTYPSGTGDGFNGAWGVFPLFDSETIVVSNIEDGLHVLTPTYRRASYLEGTVIDSVTRLVLGGVSVRINSTDLDKQAKTGTDGIYRTGQVTAGSFTVTYSKAGYIPKTITVNLQTGNVVLRDVELVPTRRFGITGTVTNATTNAPIAGAKVLAANADFSYEAVTNATGGFAFSSVPEGNYSIFAGNWGFRHASRTTNLTANSTINMALAAGYQDDFWGDFGWGTGGTAPRGRFVREVPNGTTYNNAPCNPFTDSQNDMGAVAFISGNAPNSASGDDDIDNGDVFLLSPPMRLRAYADPRIDFQYWFFNSGGTGTPNDTAKLILSNGLRDTVIWTNTTSRTAWTQVTGLRMNQFLPITDSMTVRFSTNDALPGHLLELGIDRVLVYDRTNATVNLRNDWNLTVAPNPFTTETTVSYQISPDAIAPRLVVYDYLGRKILTKPCRDIWPYASTGGGTISLSELTQNGFYFLRIEADNAHSQTIKIMKAD